MKEKLNIVLLSAANPILDSGGLIYDMYKSLTEQGHSVYIITRKYHTNLNDNMTYLYSKKKYIRFLQSIMYFVQCELMEFNKSYYMYGVNEKIYHFSTKKIFKKISFNPDLFIYAHSHRFLDTRNLYELNLITNAPIFNIPVDLGAITGGCHYSNECTKYENGCGRCPGLYSNKRYDQSYKTLMYKNKYISKTNIIFLGNTWTLSRAENSLLYKDKPRYYCDVVIDEKKYCIASKDIIRDKYSIPQDKILILFGATTITAKRKGLEYLIEALHLLYNTLDDNTKNKTALVLIGKNSDVIKSLFLFQTYSLGHIHPNNISEIYQMSDIFVNPSIQDAGPMMVVQSMMCGTPVVAFEMGNALDFIINGITGYMAQLYDSKELAERLYQFLHLSVEEKRVMSEKCREVALSKSSYKAFSDNILKTYHLHSENTLH